MYSRVTLLEIDTMRIGLPTPQRLFRREVLPGLREQAGLRGRLRARTPRGKG